MEVDPVKLLKIYLLRDSKERKRNTGENCKLNVASENDLSAYCCYV